MDINEFSDQFAKKMDEVKEFVQGDDIKDIIGVEAVNHFKESFVNEGFTDEKLEKWEDVKRRDPNSAWHGHSGQTGRFSQARTMAKILTGETKELQNSISYVRTAVGARTINAAPYAAVHQYGLQAMVYGKSPFVMPTRRFMGKSMVLKKNIEDKITSEITKILTE